MIQFEHPVVMDDGTENTGLIKHWSDSGMMIRQAETGDMYDEAIDLYPCRYTYEETDTPIPGYDEPATAADYEAQLARLGVNTDE